MGIKKFKIDFTEVNNYNLDDAILIDSDNENDTRFGYLRKYLALSGNVSIPIISKYGSATNNTVIPNGVFAQFQVTNSSNFNPISYSGLISFYINKTTQNVPNASALYLFADFSDGAGTTWNLPIYRTENEWATLADVWQKQVLLLWTFPGKFFLVGCEKNTTPINAISAESIDLNNTQYVISTSIGDNIQLNGVGTASNNIIVFPYNLTLDKSIIWFIQQGSTDITFRKYTSSTVYTDTIYSENDNIDTFFDTNEGWTFTKLDAENIQPILTNFTDVIVKFAPEAPITLIALTDTRYKMPKSNSYEGIVWSTNDLMFVYKNGEDLNGIYKYVTGDDQFIIWDHIANQNDLRTIRIQEGTNRGVMISMLENVAFSYQFLHIHKSIKHVVTDQEAISGQLYIQFPIQDGIQVFRNGIEEYNFILTASTGPMTGAITFPNGLTSGELIKLKY